MGDAHRVQDPGWVIGGRSKIGAAVNVDQRGVQPAVKRCAGDGEGEPAFTTDQQRCLTGRKDAACVLSGVAPGVQHPAQVVRPAFMCVCARSPANSGGGRRGRRVPAPLGEGA
jgi:hypothetical protein